MSIRLLASLLLLSAFAGPLAYAQGVQLQMGTVSSTAVPGDVVSIPIYVNNVTNLMECDFIVSLGSPAPLTPLSVPFLPGGWFDPSGPGEHNLNYYNSVTQQAHYNVYQDSDPPLSGSGLLCRLQCTVASHGTCSIHVVSAKFWDSSGRSVTPSIVDGSFSNSIHADLGITGTMVPATIAIGHPVTLSADVSNQGPANAPSFAVTFSVNAVPVGSVNVTGLSLGATVTASTTWDPTGWSPGTYPVSVSITEFSLDPNPADNTLSAGATRLFVNRNPYPPDSEQALASNGQAITVGNKVFDPTVLFEARVTDPDGGVLALDVELRRVGVPFSFVATSSSPPVPSGEMATAAEEVSPGDWHWQSRTRDSWGVASPWVSYAGNDETAADFDAQWEGSTGAASCLSAAGDSGVALPPFPALLAAFLGAAALSRWNISSTGAPALQNEGE